MKKKSYQLAKISSMGKLIIDFEYWRLKGKCKVGKLWHAW